MSHEGTMGMLAEAVGTDVQAVVQAVVSEPNTAAADVEVGPAQEGTDMVGTSITEKVQTKTAGVREGVTKARSKVARAKKAPTSAQRAKGKAANESARAPVADAGAKVRKVKAAQALAAPLPDTTPREKVLKFTVPEVWRSIVKKNERQGSKRFDVLVCQHAVPANDNTYRTARACPECRVTVQRYADEVAAAQARRTTHRRKA